ncbi:MAG: hypothetical protein COZ18_04445 [Flexibacter sp. CG_4_10_14_3_um_filter_32_15]|nr:MAG: hypothetical protein COZ18_04445 [Flexibacter sp. CG_4_10_14_3_um_filter_32_15]
MKIEQLINKWKINQSLLAEKLGMTKNSFSEKLRNKKSQYFSDEQKEQIRTIIQELHNDTDSISF